jgi:hypothetical protein
LSFPNLHYQTGQWVSSQPTKFQHPNGLSDVKALLSALSLLIAKVHILFWITNENVSLFMQETVESLNFAI